jgi:hypothetical protein
MSVKVRIANCAVALGLLLVGSTNGQDAGAIVGWGQQVVVPQSELTDLVAIAGGGYHSLGLKAHYGDLNCDGVVNFDDINPFVSTLGSDPLAWNLAHPGCHWLNADCNADGVVNFDDINAFVALLSGG